MKIFVFNLNGIQIMPTALPQDATDQCTGGSVINEEAVCLETISCILSIFFQIK